MIIEFVGPLKNIAATDRLELKIDGEIKLMEILEMLPEHVKKRVLKPTGEISPDVIILVNGLEIKSLGLENFFIKSSDKIVLIPVIHGG